MIVGITAPKIKHQLYNEYGHYLNIKWQKLAKKIGINLVILSNIETTNRFIKEKSIKAIILSGGGSLSKSFPKIDEKKNSKIIDYEREKIEKNLIKFSLKSKIPLLGICRGMQAIGMYYGIKLSMVQDHVKTRHKLSYYCPIIKKNIKRNVNSYHDYGFNTSSIPNTFTINAAHNNIAEQIVHKDEKILCLMWHPEREIKFNKLDVDLLKIFFNIKK